MNAELPLDLMATDMASAIATLAVDMGTGIDPNTVTPTNVRLRDRKQQRNRQRRKRRQLGG